MLRIIDAHIHVWALDDGERFPLREKIAALQRDFALDELRGLQDANGVSGCVLVQAVDSVSESRRLLMLAQEDPRVLGVVCWADMSGPGLTDVLDEYRESPAFVGVRPMPADTFAPHWLSAETTRAALRALRTADCTVDFLVPLEGLAALRATVREHAGLRCVLNHCGRPAVMAGMSAGWRAEMNLLARETDIVVKCSGLVERAGVEWNRATLQPWVAHLLETFGAGRVMFASNWPILTLASNYGLWLRTLQQILEDLRLDDDSVADVLWRTAMRFYRLGERVPHYNFQPMDKEKPCH